LQARKIRKDFVKNKLICAKQKKEEGRKIKVSNKRARNLCGIAGGKENVRRVS
jgi:hypothetical protein